MPCIVTGSRPTPPRCSLRTFTARLATSGIVGDALVAHVAQGNAPSLILGDFNGTEEELQCTYALEHAGWYDLVPGVASALPPNSSTPRRIDHVYANPAARRVVADARVVWEEGLHVHAVHQVTLLYAAGQRYRKWTPPRPLPAPVPTAPTPVDAWGQARAEHAGALAAAMAGRCPDRAWNALENALTRYYELRTDQGLDRRAPGRASWAEVPRARGKDSAAGQPVRHAV